MELKEFFSIFVSHKKIFFGIILCSVSIGIILYIIQPTTYKTDLTLNVTRDKQSQEKRENDYDDFYRLQADERFSDTVVQWIKAPHIIFSVFDPVSAKKVTAKRLSSQVVRVTYVTHSAADAQETAETLVSALNQESQKLNQQQRQSGWFVVVGSKPIVTTATYTLHFLLGLFLSIGVFVGFWTVVIVHYAFGRDSVSE